MDSANTKNYRKSMRAPVAVACNRIISAQSDSGQEGGGRMVFSRLASAYEGTVTPPTDDKYKIKESQSV